MIDTAGAFIYSVSTKTILVLHPTNGRWNQWSIPKGHVEQNESPIQACIRECFEETKLKINLTKLRYLGRQIYKSNKKQLYAFIYFTKQEFKPYLDKENDKYKWIPIYKIPDYLHESQIGFLDKITNLTLQLRG